MIIARDEVPGTCVQYFIGINSQHVCGRNICWLSFAQLFEGVLYRVRCPLGLLRATVAARLLFWLLGI